MRTYELYFTGGFMESPTRTLVESCVPGTLHQGSPEFSAFSRGRQCTPISYFAVLYSSIVNVEAWMPETVDFILSQSDSIYNSVAHTHAYFDYTELPLSIYLSNSVLCRLHFPVIIQTLCTVMLLMLCLEISLSSCTAAVLASL